MQRFSAGKDAILARRIGKGELAAIAVLNNLVDGERDYFNQTHDGDKTKQYAQKFISDDGKQNGLYWPASQGESTSPLEGLTEFAKSLGYTNASGKPQPFNGYYFQILDRQRDEATGICLRSQTVAARSNVMLSRAGVQQSGIPRSRSIPTLGTTAMRKGFLAPHGMTTK